MKFIDLTLHSPEENLALDEELLDEAENGKSGETLRFWESKTHFVVLGFSNRAENETHPEACRRDQIPILKRSSGGGTVLQGPGCLNYALVLEIAARSGLGTVRSTNAWIMERHRQALEEILKKKVTVEGYTDLAVAGLKFSGNAQRRKRRFVLFHGTFLLNFDIALMGKYLASPSREPAYRRGRPHESFVTNLHVPTRQIRSCLTSAWRHEGPRKPLQAANSRRIRSAR